MVCKDNGKGKKESRALKGGVLPYGFTEETAANPTNTTKYLMDHL